MINVLLVCRKKEGNVASFIKEQAESLIATKEVKPDFFFIEGKLGDKISYFKFLRKYLDYIKMFKPDVIHAHYSISGLFANFQRKVPVVTTYHGSDLNVSYIKNLFSLPCIALSKHNVFVFEKKGLKFPKDKSSVIPCGVDIKTFKPLDKIESKKILGLNQSYKYVLFAGSFDNSIKNPQLAFKTLSNLKNVELVELRGYSREQVVLLMNACDSLLLTSKSEGSPQVVKEAMACNMPIVSTNVGDVQMLLNGVDGAFVCDLKPDQLADKLKRAIELGKSNGRKKLINMQLDIESVSKKILEVYKNILI